MVKKKWLKEWTQCCMVSRACSRIAANGEVWKLGFDKMACCLFCSWTLQNCQFDRKPLCFPTYSTLFRWFAVICTGWFSALYSSVDPEPLPSAWGSQDRSFSSSSTTSLSSPTPPSLPSSSFFANWSLAFRFRLLKLLLEILSSPSFRRDLALLCSSSRKPFLALSSRLDLLWALLCALEIVFRTGRPALVSLLPNADLVLRCGDGLPLIVGDRTWMIVRSVLTWYNLASTQHLPYWKVSSCE